MAEVAVGIRPHCGWAIVVAVTAPPVLELVVRRRIEVLADGDPRQPWHQAQELGLGAEEALALHDRVADGAAAAADVALAEVVAEVRAAGHVAIAAGVVGEPKDLPDPARILVNHTLLHTAEGELYRAVLTEAAEALGLPVTCFHQKAVPVAPHADALAAIRSTAGPPWTADHRLAAATALAALAVLTD